MVPRILHQTWKTDNVPERFQAYAERWSALGSQCPTGPFAHATRSPVARVSRADPAQSAGRPKIRRT